MRKFIFLLLNLPLLLTAANSKDCDIGDACNECKLLTAGSKCFKDNHFELLFCHNDTQRIDISENFYLACDTSKHILYKKSCPFTELFMNGRCQSPQSRFKREGISGSGRVLDQCNFNTDCLGGMFCLGGACNCLSNYVAIQGYCYIKKNPGESGCQYNEQCSAVWPESTCKQSKCECPEDVNGVPYVMSRTRDGVVCILHSGEDGDSTPKCPLPEYDDDLLSMPVSQLRNPAMTDPDDQDIPMGEHINPLQFCNTKSTDYTSFVANGGGACVYGQEPFSQGNGIYIADLYDCVGAPSAMSNVKSAMEGVYDISKNADGICCMSRAMTCSQPKREANTGSSAPASGVRPRWWYNQITNNCEQFLFNGWQEDEMQSPNNFKTRDHCMAYCSDDSSCKKGSPQYMSGPILNEDEPIGNCQTASSCGSGFECHSKGSQSLCCQTVASLCSNSGGRPIDLLRTTNFDPGFAMKKTFSLNYPSTSRYYYDSDQNRCIAFTFLGGFGNFNNFASSQECDLFCGKLVCSIGSPLKIGNQNQKCASNTDCPSSYECSSDHSVCCPRKQSVCSQPLRLGDCKNSVKRYWYNAGQKTCEMFFYTGCQGNDNSFSSKSECEGTCSNVVPEPQCTQGEAYKDYQGNYYVSSNSVCPINYEPFFDTNINTNVCCPSKSYTCSLSSHKGVVCGSGSSFRYFFNSKTQECQSFAYDGCDGNSNNFATIKDCQEYCGVGNCANGGVPEINEFGQLIVCSDSNKCPSSDTECVSLNQGFSIINRCCPTRIHVCSMPVKNGMGSSASTRFYFNKIIKECTPFTYNGNGNLNSFPSLQACNNYCLSATCAAGENAYLNPNTNTPYECNPSLTTSCPRNYRCIYNSLTELHICCGTPPTASDVCEDSAKAYMNIDGTVKECLINIDGSCPSNYLCTFNSKNRGKYYCCKTENFCPIGKSVFKDSSSKSPIRCTISGTNNQCPDNHSCQSEIRNAFQGYCCSSREVCPNNAEFFVEENTQMPRSCTIGAFITCPNGFSCQSVDNSAISGFCCKGEITSAASDGCPPGEFAVIQDGTSVCDPFNPLNSPCHQGTCQFSVSMQRYQCCSSTPSLLPRSSTSKNSYKCPSNQIPFLDKKSGSPKLCTSGGLSETETCPSGYFCQYSSNSQYICCGINGNCPNDGVSFIGVSGHPETCSFGANTCPDGFSCQKTKLGTFVCCTIEEVSCKEHEVVEDNVCMPKVNFDEKCVSSKQCPDTFMCKDQTCKCALGLSMINGQCKTTCPTGQVSSDEKCYDIRDIEEPCEVAAQCQHQSECFEGVCLCLAPLEHLNGVCKKNKQVVNTKTFPASSVCPISGQQPYIEKKSNKIRNCTPGKNACPNKNSCQWSPSEQKNICCGKQQTVTGTLPSSNPAHLKLSKNSKGTSNATMNVCEKSSPYLVNGAPQTCSKDKKCTATGFSCIFSKKYKNYFCCATQSQSDGGCSQGSPLLFPSTGTAVQCVQSDIPSEQACPEGFVCLKSTNSNNYQCCSSISNYRFSPRKFGSPPAISACPKHLFQVQEIVNGRLVKKCEPSCPPHQIASIRGVCREINLFRDDPIKSDFDDTVHIQTNELNPSGLPPHHRTNQI